MSTTYTWSINRMDCLAMEGGHTDVVSAVYWQLSGDDGSTACSVFDVTPLTLDLEEPFTPYADLTQAQVLGWVQDTLGADVIAAHEANITQLLAQIETPPPLIPALPWE